MVCMVSSSRYDFAKQVANDLAQSRRRGKMKRLLPIHLLRFYWAITSHPRNRVDLTVPVASYHHPAITLLPSYLALCCVLQPYPTDAWGAGAGFTSSLPAWFELTRSYYLVVTSSGLTDVGNRKRLQCT
jgi:hypothetical protein